MASWQILHRADEGNRHPHGARRAARQHYVALPKERDSTGRAQLGAAIGPAGGLFSYNVPLAE